MDWAGRLIRDALAAHNVVFAEGDDAAVVLGTGLCLRAQAHEHPERNSTKIIQLDVLYYGGPLEARIFEQNVAGVGETLQEAARQAAEKFLSTSFHVMLHAAGGHACNDAPSTEVWAGDHGAWNAILSPLISTGFERPAGIPISRLLEDLRASFLDRPRLGIHAVEIFFAFSDGAFLQGDIRLNGEAWPHGAQMLDQWACEPPPGYATGRMFVAVVPT